MTLEPNRETARNAAFYLAAMEPAEQREALGKLAVAVARGMVEQFRWSPEQSAEFTRAFVSAVVDQLPQMAAEQKAH